MTLNNTKSNNTTILAIENDTNQQKLCKAYDSHKNLDKLLNPAFSHECVLQKISDQNDANLEDLSDFPPNNNNFEDYLGIFKLLDSNLNRESIPNEIEKRLYIGKIYYLRIQIRMIVQTNSHKIFLEIWRAVDNACKQFNQNSKYSMSGHVCYDLERDQLIFSQRNQIKYDDEGTCE